MRSGLWILLLVVVAGIVVGTLLKGRLEQPEGIDEITVLRRIAMVEDPKDKIVQLRQFLVEYPDSEYRPDALYMIAGAMLDDLGDTLGMIAFAEKTLGEESDPETQARMYYRLYRATSETQADQAYGYASRLLDSGMDVAWVYNYIAFDFAEKGIRLDAAERLADRAVGLAESAEDSASYLDTRGWVHYQQQDYKKAIGDLEEAVRVAPEPSDEVLGHLAQAQLRTGRVDEAFKTFRAVLLMGEYESARENIEVLMDQKGYTSRQKKIFESDLWKERLAQAEPVAAFTLPALDGNAYEYSPGASNVSIINFFSPT